MGTAAEHETRIGELEKEWVRAEEWWREQWRKNETMASGIKDNAEDIDELNLKMARLGPYIGLAAALGAILGGLIASVILKVGFGL